MNDVASTLSPTESLGLDSLAVIRLWALADAFETRLANDLSGLGLTIAGFRLIGEVMRSPNGRRQSELAALLRVRPPTVSAAVSKLEEQGLIRRIQDPDDPRAWRVCLAEGAPLFEGVALLQRIDADLTDGLSTTQSRQLLETLDALLRNLTPPEENA